MNRSILTSFLLVIMSLAYGQDFAPIGAVWHYEQTNVHPPFNHDLWEFRVQKDTIIQGDSCRKIQATIRSLRINRSDTLQRTEYHLVRIRKGKVDYYFQDKDTFIAYLDFNLGAGDTLHTVCDDHAILPFEVLIDSVTYTSINGNSLRVQHISRLIGNNLLCYMGDRIIERIGPVSYFFGFNGIADPGKGGPLRCYEDATIGLYRHTEKLPCDFITSVENPDQRKVDIYPNPCYSTLRIKNGSFDRVELYDYTGNQVLSEKFKPELNIEHLSPGQYVNILRSSSSTSTRRLTKL